MPPLTTEERLILAAIIQELDITAARMVLRQIIAVMSKYPSVKSRTMNEILKDAQAYNKMVQKKGD